MQGFWYGSFFLVPLPQLGSSSWSSSTPPQSAYLPCLARDGCPRFAPRTGRFALGTAQPDRLGRRVKGSQSRPSHPPGGHIFTYIYSHTYASL